MKFYSIANKGTFKSAPIKHLLKVWYYFFAFLEYLGKFKNFEPYFFFAYFQMYKSTFNNNTVEFHTQCLLLNLALPMNWTLSSAKVNYPCHQIYMYLLILWMTLGWSFDIHSPFFMKNLSIELPPIRSGWLSSHWLLLWVFWISLLHTIN